MVLYQIFVFGADFGKRFPSLVQDQPMIIPVKSQFNWLGGF
jgi:hypothetical protein